MTLPMPTVPRLSFVIANYNYERFLADAITSALAVDWPDIEVIVVDDGSTDNSRTVIERFGKRVTAILKENGGQRRANNDGFAASTGDIVTFLDADDLVERDYAREVVAAWRPGVSKIQVLMRLVDGENEPIGGSLPRISTCPSASQIRDWAMQTSEYPTPPGSGNAYSRDFLARLFPLGEEHDDFTDSTCLALAPLLGDVETVMKPLVRYRQHGANDSNIFADPHGFHKEVNRAIRRQSSLEQICDKLGIEAPPRSTLRRSFHLLQLRTVSYRMSPAGHPDLPDSRLRIFGDALLGLLRDNYLPIGRRAALTAWVMAALFLPKRMLAPIVAYRFQL